MEAIQKEMEYEYWLASLSFLSPGKKIQLRRAAGSAESIYYIEETKLKKMGIITEKELCAVRNSVGIKEIGEKYERFIKKGGRFIPYFDKAYPEKLKSIPSPPYALYVKGSVPDDKKPSAAIVGARKCTPYGEQMALHFGEVLAEAGVQIISGMARGVDCAGQRGALNAGGCSYGILGCGVDICYPKENKGLYKDLENRGGIISEYPEGTPPRREHFPARNRIISGLADIVLVMEAREKSGSLITADMALEQGRDVYALPGPVTSSLSEGCNGLIRQGAGILLSPENLLEELEISGKTVPANTGQKLAKNEKMLESTEKLVYSKLDLYPKSLSLLLEETGLLPDRLADCMISLELLGYAKEISKNYYIKQNE